MLSLSFVHLFLVQLLRASVTIRSFNFNFELCSQTFRTLPYELRNVLQIFFFFSLFVSCSIFVGVWHSLSFLTIFSFTLFNDSTFCCCYLSDEFIFICNCITRFVNSTFEQQQQQRPLSTHK